MGGGRGGEARCDGRTVRDSSEMCLREEGDGRCELPSLSIEVVTDGWMQGGNEEAALKTELNKNKFRLRNEWTALKVTMNASRPPPLPHGAEDFELHEAWVEASAAVDANVSGVVALQTNN